ncbi:ACADM isoform 7 [Pan troglodytes]|uniref:Acyl-CoA dehydrogenase C-4 to C-12 straight chain isoform 3 n=2 Tax=Homininae TaxID=207598 RepID=E9PIX8_HUMAN|nr:acyl-CoA dehydrogenase C-4 to C-12 straight chain isoform 3 [Homo sapiens]PNI47818.1 ACADM isoform 6 [Pan troglodytes]PNI47819.1 ACADM isoform 7 [Pan troglodytes]
MAAGFGRCCRSSPNSRKNFKLLLVNLPERKSSQWLQNMIKLVNIQSP